MNKLNTQKFMTLFNDILSDKNGVSFADLLPDYANKDLKGDEMDLVNNQKEQLLNLRLNGRNLLFMKKIEKAKQKIIDGTFGICEDCGDEISQKRLAARPTASSCISCQEEKERSEHLSFKHRRDLKLLKNVSESNDGEEIVNKDKLKFNHIDDIKFESVVDF